MSQKLLKLLRLEFEVYGKVQGVFFRKYTKEKSDELGLKGWCMNTERNTVRGVIEGDAERVTAMKKWLQETGSPKSKIEKLVVISETPIGEFSFHVFEIRR